MKLGVYTAILHDKPLKEALEIIASLGLAWLVGKDFFPAVDSGQMRLHARAPAGTGDVHEPDEPVMGRRSRAPPVPTCSVHRSH